MKNIASRPTCPTLGSARGGFNTKTRSSRRFFGDGARRGPRNDTEIHGKGERGNWRASGSPQRPPRARRFFGGWRAAGLTRRREGTKFGARRGPRNDTESTESRLFDNHQPPTTNHQPPTTNHQPPKPAPTKTSCPSCLRGKSPARHPQKIFVNFVSSC